LVFFFVYAIATSFSNIFLQVPSLKFWNQSQFPILFTKAEDRVKYFSGAIFEDMPGRLTR
jgi:hypothetical protein